jgi:outer membrane receptor for ferrienterochelin and colicins
MPIVSGLSTVYLSGIPNSLLERIEIVKGPLPLYGSEAVGGLINIITKNPKNAPVDAFATGWGEVNVDIGFKANIGNAAVLTGINYFNYSNPIDNNKDNFTDLTLQDRISVFQNGVSTERTTNYSLCRALFFEDRWGGELQWENTAVELTFMVKAFTQNDGNYWVLMNFLLQKNVVFIFLYGPRPKLHLW